MLRWVISCRIIASKYFRSSQNSRPFFSSASLATRGVKRQPIPAGQPLSQSPKHSPIGSLLLRCGLFTGVSISCLFVGSSIAGFEVWRRRALHLKRGQESNTHATDLFHIIRRKWEQVIGRPLHPSDVYWATPARSMLWSVFSHNSFLHFAINMYVLHSFTPTIVNLVGPGDYLFLLLGGGIFGSYLSLVGKALRRSSIPSLGASGGICAVLGAFCLLQPTAQLCVPFVVNIIPHSFEAKSAAWTLLVVEFLGSIFFVRRSPLDHAAHFGGLAFGMFYSLQGTDTLWKRKQAIISRWRRWRGL